MDFVRIRASESCRTAYDWEVYSMNNNIVSKSIILGCLNVMPYSDKRKIANLQHYNCY